MDGKLHIFFANFDGLVAGQNAVQTPQKGIRVSLPAGGTGRAWFLPFLGEAVELDGQRQNGDARVRAAGRSEGRGRVVRARWLLGAVAQLLEPEPRADLYLPLRERRVGNGPGRLAIVDVVVG